jgi:EAL domain-containing protein (putative c-di-GMP-specific phosphodiesterase class I)
MRVVALGVDDSHQLEVLQSLGCDSCQGDLFSPPLQAAGLLEHAGAAQPDGTLTTTTTVPS